MGLDYNYTCPSIDEDINDLKAEIKSYLESVVDELNPFIDFKRDDVKAVISESGEGLYEQLSYLFEKTRQTNEDMRTAAEKQIQNIEDELSDLKDINSELDSRVTELESEISSLESELSSCG